jgi:cyclic pyranopterin phosphate synthase
MSEDDRNAPDRGLSHVGRSGEARMVDVGAKPDTERVARAIGRVRMRAATLEAIIHNTLKKGDVIAVARVAGILAAKRTAELIPLCHPIPLTDIQVQLVSDPTLPGIRVEATARTTWKTGVEMEALTAVTVSLLTIYDMAKSLDREMELGDISLVQKSGGKLDYEVKP